MDRREGDRTLEWTPGEEQSVKLARDEFEQLVNGEGRFRFQAYSVTEKNGKREGTQLKPEVPGDPVAFDESAEEILLVPPLAGGC